MIRDRTIALSKLVRWNGNVRTTQASTEDDIGLAASIRAHGMIQSLLVRASTTRKKMFEVGAGGRRLTAAQAIAKSGGDPEMPIPCRVAEGEDATDERFTEMSIAENTERTDLHFCDEIRAFARHRASGATVSGIATRFGIAERRVRQRLKLASCADEVLDAHRDGVIDRPTLEAFSLAHDTDEQRRLLERLEGQTIDVWTVRQNIVGNKMNARHPIARYVGVDSYVDAGGPVTEDLFPASDEEALWIGEPERMRTLAQACLDDSADRLRAQGWAWVETDLAGTHQGAATFDRTIGTLDEHDTEELAGYEKTLNEAVDHKTRYNAESAMLVARERLEPRRRYDTETMAKCGVVVSIDGRGNETVVRGLMRPENLDRRNDTPPDEQGATANADTEAAQALPAGAIADLRYMRSEVLRLAIADDAALARDLVTFQLVRTLVGPGPWGRTIGFTIDGGARGCAAWCERAGIEGWSAKHGVPARERVTRATAPWAQHERAEAWTALRSAPEAARKALHAACVASLCMPKLATDPDAQAEIEAIAATIDWSAHVRPSARHFWGRLKREQMLDTAGAVLGDAWRKAHASTNRTALAERLEAIFAGAVDPGEDGLDAAAIEAARTWTPPGIAPLETRLLASELDEVGDTRDEHGADECPAESEAQADSEHEEAQEPEPRRLPPFVRLVASAAPG